MPNKPESEPQRSMAEVFFSDPPATRIYGFSNRDLPTWSYIPKNADLSKWIEVSAHQVEELAVSLGLILSDNVMSLLSDLLTCIRNTKLPCDQDIFGIVDKHKTLYKSVEAIIELAPTFIKANDAAIGSGTFSISTEQFVRHSALKALLQAALAVILTQEPPRAKPHGIAHWHEDAVYLAVILQTGSTTTIAVTHPDAPAVKFISQALDLARVNHSGLRAISDELKRRKRDPKWGRFLGGS